MNEAARALVLEHWQWAAELARRQARKVSVLDADEVAGDALVALVEAARRFKPGRGVKFRSFARHRIHGAVRDHQRRQDLLGRWERGQMKAGRVTKWARRGGTVPVIVRDDVGDIAADPNDNRASHLATQPNQEATVLRSELRAYLRRLPGRGGEILRRHYLLDETMATIGASMRITESRVCQLAGEACRTLRDIIAEDPRGSP